MKKQICILMLAVFAIGIPKVFAQPPGWPANTPYLLPTPLQCIDLDNPLQVVPGHEYTYSIDVPTPDGDKTYHWFVTQNYNFIQNGVLQNTFAEPIDGSGPVLASGSLHYNTAAPNQNSINLTWKSFTMDTNEYVFVVIYVQNTAPGGCVTDNLKVYRIRPLHSFTLDIANVDRTTNNIAVADFAQCVSDVHSAIFDPTANQGSGGVSYDFGRDSLFFVVAAANFTGDYRLSIRFEGDALQDATPAGTEGQVATLYHGSDWSTVVNAATGGINLLDGTDGVNFVVNNDGSVGPVGLMHFIKIVIEHNRFEATEGPYNYTVQIDGILVDDAGAPLGPATDFGDMVDGAIPATPDCTFGYVAWAKEANQVLTRRPTIISVGSAPPPAPAPAFLPIVE